LACDQFEGWSHKQDPKIKNDEGEFINWGTRLAIANVSPFYVILREWTDSRVFLMRNDLYTGVKYQPPVY
jgi:hypothetical protein